MFCQSCGAENQDDATFCNECGMALVPISVQSAPKSKRRRDESTPRIQKKENLHIDFVSGPGSTPVPSTNNTGIIFWIAICIGLVLVFVIGVPFIMGMAKSTQTTEISKVAAIPTVAPTRSIVQGQDPIIGTWHWNAIGQSKTIFYTFTSDGHYSTSDSISDFTESGTWQKNSENRYDVTVHYRNISFIYQPETDTVAMADTPDLRYYPPGRGSAIITPTPFIPTVRPTIVTTDQTSVPVYHTTWTSSGSGGGSSGKCWVNSYTRKDGTHVSGYYRSC